MATCKFCDKEGGDMITCASCRGLCHPNCLELPDHIVPIVKTYDWQCNDCKFCYQCHNIENEQKILFCDACDRGYHTYCVQPPLKRKPKGDWYCAICCANKSKQEIELSGGNEKRSSTENTNKEDEPPDISDTTTSLSKKTRTSKRTRQSIFYNDSDIDADIDMEIVLIEVENESNKLKQNESEKKEKHVEENKKIDKKNKKKVGVKNKLKVTETEPSDSDDEDISLKSLKEDVLANKKDKKDPESELEKEKSKVSSKKDIKESVKESTENGKDTEKSSKKEDNKVRKEKGSPKDCNRKSLKDSIQSDISSFEEKNSSSNFDKSSNELARKRNDKNNSSSSSIEKENMVTPNKMKQSSDNKNIKKSNEKLVEKSIEKSSSKKDKIKKLDIEKTVLGSGKKDKNASLLENGSPLKSAKKCLYAKSSSINQCPFNGCDGIGNTRNNRTFHVSLNSCPMSKESRKREKEVESKDESSPSPPKKKFLQSTPDNENLKELNKETQTPIENIVSSTDIELFEQAKSKAVLALSQEMAPNPDGLKSIIFGDVEIGAWYKSQYSIEFSKLPILYICEFCLCYMKTRTIYDRHMAKCTLRNPPGDEIYRKDDHSVFEVNGATAMAYCQNLCLMAKLFLDHKTLWLDVAPFLFYIMTINDDKGCHIVGYFSKEKVSFLNYNVSCILVLPHHMKRGYGRLLIEFSYLLTASEGKTGSPERPLSDMGLISYRKFWAEKLMKYLIDYQEKDISFKSISEKMAIQANDVVSTLQYLGLLKYWKGKHLILLRKEVVDEYALKVKVRPEDYKEIDAKCLKWTPPPVTATKI